MSRFQVKVKWGKETFSDVELNTGDEPMLFKAQLFALTGVQPHRQKVLCKGTALKDESWDEFDAKLKSGAVLLLMGSKEEDIPQFESEKEKFEEDLDVTETRSYKGPAGLLNLGNTCYMNSTIQFLKSVPEFREAVLKFDAPLGRVSATDHAYSITLAVRELFKSMDGTSCISPMILLQVLHNAFPRFSERDEDGTLRQQDANECWIEMMGMLKQMLKDGGTSVIDRYFGVECEAEVKCIESEEEPPAKSVEKFLQLSCYIDKEVRYLSTGLANRMQETMTKHCSALNRDAEYRKQLRITRLPGYLTIQMVRFQFKQKEAINAKILKDVKFPLLLDVYDLCSSDLQQALTPMRTKFKIYQDKNLEKMIDPSAKKENLRQAPLVFDEKETELLPYWFENDPGSNNSGYYELQAILTHRGRSSNSGHYEAWVRGKSIWFECNDDIVRPVHDFDILRLSGGGDWHTAYLLLYGPRRLPKEGATEDQSDAEVK